MSKESNSGVHKVFQSYENKNENPQFEKDIKLNLQEFEKDEFKKIAKEEKKLAKEKNTEEKKIQKEQKKKILPFWLDVLINILIIAGLLFLFRTYIFSPFNVSGPSMESTLHDTEFIYVDKLIPYFTDYERGQIIVFYPPTDTMTDETGLMCVYDKIKNSLLMQGNQNPCRVKASFVKRIIGIPGDRVEIKDGSVFVTPKGGKSTKISETFLDPKNQSGTCIPANRCSSTNAKESRIYPIVPQGKLFVLGDNRKQSSDSRSNRWDSHFIDQENIIGITRAVYLSPQKFKESDTFIEKISKIFQSFSGMRLIPQEELF